MSHAVAFVGGLLLALVALGALAGPWWAVLAAGVLLSAGSVLSLAQGLQGPTRRQ